jgi:hypothetical protein
VLHLQLAQHTRKLRALWEPLPLWYWRTGKSESKAHPRWQVTYQDPMSLLCPFPTHSQLSSECKPKLKLGGYSELDLLEESRVPSSGVQRRGNVVLVFKAPKMPRNTLILYKFHRIILWGSKRGDLYNKIRKQCSNIEFGLKHIRIRGNKTDRITRRKKSYGERIRMTFHIDLGHMKLNRKVKTSWLLCEILKKV